MSETLMGAKSKLYIKDTIPGQTALDSQDSLQHVTAQEVEGQRVGMDVIIHGKYPVVPSIAIAAGSAKRLIKLIAHGLTIGKKGYFLKPLGGNAEGEEVAILSVVDVDTVIIAAELDMAIGDLVEVARYITPNYTEDGDLNVVVNSAGVIQFELDGVNTNVQEDTSFPFNSKALPSKMFIEIDGIQYPVRKDTGTPSNTVSIPVELSGVAGPVNITAGDLNVQLTDLGASFDRTRIGDGSGNQLGINASSEALVHDADALTELQALVATDFATEATQSSVLTEIQTLVGVDFATEVKQDSIISGLVDVETELETLNTVDFATEAKQDTQITRLNLLATEAKQDTQITRLNLLATEAKQDTQITRLNLLATEAKQDTQITRLNLLATEATLAALLALNSKSGTPSSAQVTVGVARVRATVAGTAPNAARKKLIIKPSSANTGRIWLGGSAVTTANGLEIIGPDRLEFDVDPSDYYLISDTAAQIVEIIEVV